MIMGTLPENVSLIKAGLVDAPGVKPGTFPPHGIVFWKNRGKFT